MLFGEISIFHANAEITLEANPGDLDLEYLASLRNLGVNRLNIGVQSFNEEDFEISRPEAFCGASRLGYRGSTESWVRQFRLRLDLRYSRTREGLVAGNVKPGN